MESVRKKARIKECMSDRVFNMINMIILTFALIVVVYPLIYILSASFSSTKAVTGGAVWLLPVHPTTYAYKIVLKYNKVWMGYLNSLIYTVVGTIIGVTVTILASYPLARKGLVGKKAISSIFLFTMLFNGGLIPTYLVIKNLHMIDTLWAIVIPGATSAYNIIVMRTYFENTIPTELYESAELDGCSDFRMLWKIVIPLSGAILAVIALFFAVWLWNSYFNALIYLNSETKYPLQIILREILIMNDVDTNMMVDINLMLQKQGITDVLRYVLIVVASAPLLLVYPFVQKFFIRGVMIGSIKG